MPLLSTDTPIDQIILFKEGSVSVSPITAIEGGWYMGDGSVTIPHSLSFAPLPYVEYSLTPDFTDVSTMELVPVDFILASPSQSIHILCRETAADNSNIYVSFWNFNSSSTTTVYYRIYGFAPTNAGTTDVPPTAGLGSLNVPVFNTDLNYMKIVGSGTSSGGTINFNSPISQAWVWSQDIGSWGEGIIEPIYGEYLYNSFGTIDRQVIIGNSSLALSTAYSSSGRLYHYRVYA